MKALLIYTVALFPDAFPWWYVIFQTGWRYPDYPCISPDVVTSQYRCRLLIYQCTCFSILPTSAGRWQSFTTADFLKLSFATTDIFLNKMDECLLPGKNGQEERGEVCRFYLDNSATTNNEEVTLGQVMRVMEFGSHLPLQPWSLKAEKKSGSKKKSMAAALELQEEEIFFTSCGTESDNTWSWCYGSSTGKNVQAVITA